MTAHRKWRMGMVGGGPGAFIGPVHRIAAELDGRIELVAGAFSQSPERSSAAGETYKIDPSRAYANYEAMLDGRTRKCRCGSHRAARRHSSGRRRAGDRRNS